MVKDTQVRSLFKMVDSGMTQEKAALKAGMTRKTARRYLAKRMLPSELAAEPRAYRTREDPFDGVWSEVEAFLDSDPRLEAKTLFEDLLARGTMALKETLAKNLESAVDHCRIIEKYGRFPHRNALLGRPNTASEDKYLTQAGEGF